MKYIAPVFQIMKKSIFIPWLCIVVIYCCIHHFVGVIGAVLWLKEIRLNPDPKTLRCWIFLRELITSRDVINIVSIFPKWKVFFSRSF
jgi:hypothetical protein